MRPGGGTESWAQQHRLWELERLASEQQWRTRTLNDTGMWTWEVRSTRVRVFGSLFAQLGVSSGSVAMESLLGLVHPDEVERVRGKLDAAGRSPVPDFEFRACRPDGTVLVLQTNSSPVDDDGPLRLVGTIRDITRLRELEHHVADRAAPDGTEPPPGQNAPSGQVGGGAGKVVDLGTWEWVPVTDVVEFSARFRRTYLPQYTGGLRVGDVLDAVHPDDREHVAGWVDAARRPCDEAMTDLEFRAAAADGGWRTLRLHAEALAGREGQRRFAGTAYDITEQRMLERQLAQHEAWLSGTGRAEGIASWEWDTATGRVEMTEALRELFGFDAETAITARMVGELVHRRDRAAVVTAVRALREIGGPPRDELEFRVRRADGSIRTVRLYAEVAGTAGTPARRLIGTVHDVTRLRALERKVAHDRVLLAEARKTARIGSWAWRVGSAELEIGPEAHEVFGLEIGDEVRFSAALSRIHPDDAHRMRESMAAVLGERGRSETELRYRHTDGRYRVLRAYAERVADDNGDAWVVGNVHDLTRLRELEHTVHDGHKDLVGLGKLLQVGSWALDPATGMVEVSGWIRELCGVAVGEVIAGEQLLEHSYAEDAPNARARMRAVLDGHGPGEFELRFVDRRGGHHMAHVFARLRTEPDGRPRVVGTAYDLTAQWLAETKVQRSVQRYADLVAASPLGIALVDDAGTVADVNQALCELLGAARASLLGASVHELADFDDADSFAEYAERASGQPKKQSLCRADGTTVGCQVRTAASVQDDGRTFWVLMCSDLGTGDAAAKRHGTDELTGLPGRARVQVELRELLEQRPARAGKCAVLFCDVDNFARINDSLGHDFGDRVLVALAARLRDELPPACLAARHSGDEFVVLCPDLRAAGGLDRLVQCIRDALERSTSVGAQQVQVSVSIGAAVPGTGAGSDVDLLRFADAAVFESKRKGGGAFSVAGAALIESMSSKMALESQLRAVLDGDAGADVGLTLHFQPVVDAEGVPVGGEALLRWEHPERGTLCPDKFPGVAAEADLLCELDRWVLRRALEEASRWPCPDRNLRVAVNLSALLPGTTGFDETVRAAITATGIDPGRVVLELVETSLVTLPPGALDSMRGLVGDGVQFAVDDFGTGYSSLARLKDLPVQIIKMDRKFVAGAGADASESDTAVVRAVVDMAKAMGRRCIAEGVERGEQFDALRAESVDGYQGWLFSPALPAAQFRALVA